MPNPYKTGAQLVALRKCTSMMQDDDAAEVNRKSLKGVKLKKEGFFTR